MKGNIQTVTNQLGDFRNQMTDQLNSIRNNFMQSIQEFYNKIVDRQNQMSYRLTSIVDDLSSVKSKVRSLAAPSSAQKTFFTAVHSCQIDWCRLLVTCTNGCKDNSKP